MDDKNQIGTVFPREAAALALEKLLATKNKGDQITAREVLEATGRPVSKMRGPIKTWARKKGLVVRSVKGDGYRIALDVEHTDLSRRASCSALKKDREALRVLVVTDGAKLDEEQSRRYDWMMSRTAPRVARAEQDAKETRAEFKIGMERVPLRLAK